MANTTQTALIKIIAQYQSLNMNQGVVDIRTLQNAIRQLDQRSISSSSSMISTWTKVAYSIGSSMRMIGQSMQSTGMLMSMMITMPLVMAGKEFGTKAAEWEQTMASIATISGKTKDQVTKDMGEILAASKGFTFGPKAMGDVVLSLTKAGFDLNTAMKLAQTGATYVTATFDGAGRTTENYAETTQTLASALRAYYGPDAAGKAIETTNMLAAVMNKANADGTDFNSAFSYLFQSARLLNIPLQDVAIAIGVMSDKGVMGSRAGRELASAFLTMSQDSNKVNDAFKTMGVSIFDAKGNFKGLETVLTDLNKAIFGTGDAQLIAAKGSTQATEAQTKAIKTAQDSLAAFSSKQLENIARIKDQTKAIQDKGKASKEELDAYQAAIAATQGSSTAVEAQTRVLANNKSVFDKLSPQMRTWIGQLRDSAETANNNQDKYNKLAGAEKKLITVGGKLSDVERIRLMQGITTQAGLRALEPLIEGGKEAWTKYKDAIENSGTAEEQAKKKLDNLIDQFALLRSNMEQTMIKAFAPLIDKYLKPLVAKLGELVTWFDNLNQKWQEAIIIGLAFAAALGPLLFAFGTMLFSMGMMVSGIASLSKVMSALGAVFSLTNLPALALILVLGSLGLAVAGVVTAILNDTTGLKKDLETPMNTIIGYFKELKEFFDKKIPDAIVAMKGFFTNLGTELLKGIDFPKIFVEIENLRAAFEKLFETIFGKNSDKTVGFKYEIDEKGAQKMVPITKLQQDAENFGGGIGKVLANLTNVVIPGFIGALAALTTAIPTALTILYQRMSELGTTRDNWVAFWNTIVASTNTGLAQISASTGLQLPTMQALFSGAMNFIVGVFDWSMAALNARLSGALQLATGIWNAFFALLNGDFALFNSSMLLAIEGFLKSFLSIVGINLDEIKAKFVTTLNEIITYTISKFGEFRALGEQLVGSMVSGIQDSITGLIDAMVGAVKAAKAAAERLLNGWNPFNNNNKNPPPPGKASGGSVYGGQTYLVGERGPELFTPRMSGTIIPNHQIAGMASGGAQSRSTTYSLQYQHIGGSTVPESEINHILQMMELRSTLNPSG